MVMGEIPGNKDGDSDRSMVKRILKIGGSIVGFLVVVGGVAQITGLIPLIFDDAPKKATATLVGADDVITSAAYSNEITVQLIRIAQRRGEQQVLQGKFAELKIQADKRLVPTSSEQLRTASDGRKIPPHIDLPTMQCPHILGSAATLRVYLYGDIGPNNIGFRKSNLVVEGLYTLSDVKDPGQLGRSNYCWIDATEVDPE